MSVKAISWVFEHSRSKLADRLVLLAIADHADDNGLNAWPSVRRLATKACVTERQVQLSLRNLIALRELHVREGEGPKGTNIYELRWVGQPALINAGGEKSSPLKNLHPRRIRSKGVKSCSPESPRTVHNPPPAALNSAAGSPPLSAIGHGSSDDPTRFLEIWNRNCGSLPKVRRLSKERKGKIRSRLRAAPEFAQDFEEVVKIAASTPFLCGKSDRRWLCTFDWLVANDTNWLRVQEGSYRDGPNPSVRTEAAVGRFDPTRRWVCDEEGCDNEVEAERMLCDSCRPQVVARLRRAGVFPKTT